MYHVHVYMYMYLLGEGEEKSGHEVGEGGFHIEHACLLWRTTQLISLCRRPTHEIMFYRICMI